MILWAQLQTSFKNLNFLKVLFREFENSQNHASCNIQYKYICYVTNILPAGKSYFEIMDFTYLHVHMYLI